MLRASIIVLLCLSFSAWTLDVSNYDLRNVREEDIGSLFALYIAHRAPIPLQPTLERYNYFRSQVLEIVAHNSNKKNTWKKTITQFTGLTMKELEGLAIMAPQHCSATNGISASPNFNAPAYVDWREAGVVTPVKNQAKCGSCWAFSSTGAIESHWALAKDTVAPLLSAQQLVDCAGDFNNFGCNGGLPSQAFEYLKHVGGLQTEIDYPYKAVDGTCYFDKKKVAVTVSSGSANITQGDEKSLLEAVVNKGPVSIAYQVIAGFKDYAGGVYVAEGCKTDPDSVNHAVLAVGYGTDKKTGLDYWLVKNSWGNAWGESGYFRIKRGVNMCGVATCASYPLIN